AYFTMPFLDGDPLSRHTGTPWPPRQAVELVRRLALALGVLHGRGLVYRDLKPSNVMLKPDGTPILMDFGLARGFEDAPRLTTPGAVLGTPMYAAPEQAHGDPAVGPAVDVYSLGVVLYELLTGRWPFSAPTLHGLLEQVCFKDPTSPSAVQRG